MSRIFSILATLIPLVVALRGGNSDASEAENNGGLKSPRILRQPMHSVLAPKFGGGAGGSTAISTGGALCDNECASTPCALGDDETVKEGISSCFAGNDYCLDPDHDDLGIESVWGHACRSGFKCGSCLANNPCHTTCSGSCDDVGTVEVCNKLSDETLCIDTQETWRDMCHTTGATCGACGSYNITDSLGDEAAPEGDGCNSGDADLCEVQDPEIAFMYDTGDSGMMIANCGAVSEICRVDPCATPTLSNLLYKGQPFTLNCITLTKANNGTPHKNFIDGCCQSTDAGQGGAPGEEE
jgi:hypothetical protein